MYSTIGKAQAALAQIETFLTWQASLAPRPEHEKSLQAREKQVVALQKKYDALSVRPYHEVADACTKLQQRLASAKSSAKWEKTQIAERDRDILKAQKVRASVSLGIVEINL